MKYEMPQLTTVNAINVIQSHDRKSWWKTHQDALHANETLPGYADWE